MAATSFAPEMAGPGVPWWIGYHGMSGASRHTSCPGHGDTACCRRKAALFNACYAFDSLPWTCCAGYIHHESQLAFGSRRTYLVDELCSYIILETLGTGMYIIFRPSGGSYVPTESRTTKLGGIHELHEIL